MEIDKGKMKVIVGKIFAWIGAQTRMTIGQLSPFARVWCNWVHAIRDLISKDKRAAVVHFRDGMLNARQSVRIFLIVAIVWFICRDADDAECSSFGELFSHDSCQLEDVNNAYRDVGDKGSENLFERDLQEVEDDPQAMSRRFVERLLHSYIVNKRHLFEGKMCTALKIDSLSFVGHRCYREPNSEELVFSAKVILKLPRCDIYEKRFYYGKNDYYLSEFLSIGSLTCKRAEAINKRLKDWSKQHDLRGVVKLSQQRIEKLFTDEINVIVRRNSKNKWRLVSGYVPDHFFADDYVREDAINGSYYIIDDDLADDEDKQRNERYVAYFKGILSKLSSAICEIGTIYGYGGFSERYSDESSKTSLTKYEEDLRQTEDAYFSAKHGFEEDMTSSDSLRKFNAARVKLCEVYDRIGADRAKTEPKRTKRVEDLVEVIEGILDQNVVLPSRFK